jgi:rubrerythrin
MRYQRGMVCLSVATLLVAAPRPDSAEEGATFAAMQIAYAREVNARTQYLAFARRADLEARPMVAYLFRAVACAESVHAANHALAIERLEGTPRSRPKDFTVAETAENLRTSIELELLERNGVYPRFADYATAECLYEPLASITYARGGEATHERLFRIALGTLEADQETLEQLPLASRVPVVLPIPPELTIRYFVCFGDGSVFTHPVGRCPNCGARGHSIVEVPCPLLTRPTGPGGPGVPDPVPVRDGDPKHGV